MKSLPLLVLPIVGGLGLAALDPFADASSPFDLALKGAIGALASAIIFLFGWFRASYKRIERQLDERDRERDKLWRHVAKLTGFARMVKACRLEDCPFSDVDLDDRDDDFPNGSPASDRPPRDDPPRGRPSLA